MKAWVKDGVQPVTAAALKRADRGKVDAALEIVEGALNEAGIGYREAMDNRAVVILTRMWMAGACDRNTFVASIRLVLRYG